jgi:hypothetical protein
MVAGDFDPEKYTKRKEENLFVQLLSFSSSVRILAIKDGTGTGKSWLIRRYRQICRTSTCPVPVGVIEFGDNQMNSAYGLIHAIAQELTKFGIKLPNYEIKNHLLHFPDTESAPIQAMVQARGVNLTKAYRPQMSGYTVNADQVETLMVVNKPTQLNNDQKEVATRECIEAFMDDLQHIAADLPIVLLLDAYEKCPDNVKEWIEESFINHMFFNNPRNNQKLALVIAGQKLPRFDDLWPTEQYNSIVHLVEKLTRWDNDHIEDYLQRQQFPYKSTDIDTISGLFDMGLPISFVTFTIHSVPEQRN